MEIFQALIIVMVATAAIFKINEIAQNSRFSFTKLEFVNVQVKHQTLMLGVAISVLIILYLVNSTNFSKFLSLGNITAPSSGVIWLGIPKNISWFNLGCSLSFFITFGTSIFVYLQFRKSGVNTMQLLAYFPWVLLFSFTNSFSEEIIYRVGIIVPLVGYMNEEYIILFSAVAFGAPHLRGMPNGIVGALMAGFLGWILAKSVIETDGIFWAWFIHFLQDVVIFSAFVMAAVSKRLQSLQKDKVNEA